MIKVSGAGSNYVGGIVGLTDTLTIYPNSKIENCYNIGDITINKGYIAGIVGLNGGNNASRPAVKLNNNYWLNTKTVYGYYQNNLPQKVGEKTIKEMQESAIVLGDAFTNDIQNADGTWKYNNGYPILKWQLRN